MCTHPPKYTLSDKARGGLLLGEDCHKCLTNNAPVTDFKTSDRCIALPFMENSVVRLSTPNVPSSNVISGALDMSTMKLNEKKSTNDEFT